MKRLKDTKIKYKIKIEILQKCIKEGSCYSNIPYQINLKIDKGTSRIWCGFNYTNKGKRELIKTIKEECYL